MLKLRGGGITLSERKNGSLETISGGSSSSEGNSKVKYYRFIGDWDIVYNIEGFVDYFIQLNAFVQSYFDNSNVYITTSHLYMVKNVPDLFEPMIRGIKKVAFPLYIYGNMVFNGWEEVDSTLGAPFKFMDYLEPITEEEFYNLD